MHQPNSSKTYLSNLHFKLQNNIVDMQIIMLTEGGEEIFTFWLHNQESLGGTFLYNTT